MTIQNRFSPEKVVSAARSLIGRLFVRALLWGNLRRRARHPHADYWRRHLYASSRIKVLPLSLAFSLTLFFVIAGVYTVIAQIVVWMLPLWLMVFSTFYCAIWITRVNSLIMRASHDGLLDEVSVIPPGRVFVFLTICKLVLNQEDAVAWLSLLRRVFAGIVLVGLLMSLGIVLTQLREIDVGALGRIVLELALIALVISVEHEQSTVIACLLAITACTRVRGQIDKTSIALGSFLLVQILSYSLAISLAFIVGALNLSVIILLFVLIRELLISALWRFVLRQANEVATTFSLE